MSGGLFPKRFDNDYRGQRLALALLAPIVLMKAAMGANAFLNTRFVIAIADKIPLDTFSPGAQEATVFMYQAWGLCLFLLSALGVLALIRYRSMVPLMFLILGAENIVRRALHLVDPFSFAQSAGPPSTGALINYALIAGLIVGFISSLTPRRGGKRA